MLGNRIRLGRLSCRLTLQELADTLTAASFPISKGGLSNYENNKTRPTEAYLSAISNAFGLSRDFFDKPDWVDFAPELYSLPAHMHTAELYAHIQIELERYLDISNQIDHSLVFEGIRPHPVSIGEPSAIVDACDHFRECWSIGDEPIHSVCYLLEKHKWLLFPLPDIFEHMRFSGIERSRGLRFTFFSPFVYTDDFRFFLLSEVSKAFVTCPAEQAEAVASQFAREILFSRRNAIREFGEKRTHIAIEELNRAKHLYGISKRNIMLRLRELNIISDESYTNFQLYLNQNSHLRRENNIDSNLRFFEVPTSYSALVSHAQSEGVAVNGLMKVF